MKLHGRLLLAIVPVIAGALLVLGVAVYAQLRASSENEFHQRMDTLIGQTREQMDTRIATTRANARLFATSNLIERYLREEDEAERYELMQPALLQLFASYRDAYPDYREIRLLLPDGYEDTRLADVGLPNLTEEEGDESWFRAAVATDGPYSAIVRSPDDGRMVLIVVHPVRVRERDVDPALARTHRRGYVVVTVGLAELERQVRLQRFGEQGHLEVLDRSGTVLFAPHGRHVGTAVEGLVDEISPGENQTTVIRSLHGVPSHLRGQWLADELLLIAALPLSEFSAASRWIAATVAIVTIVAIWLAAALVFLSLRQLVMQPLRELGRRARDIGEGRLDTVLEIERDDEIGELANAFREMSRKLATTLDELRGSHAHIAELAFRDSLTGLPNRRLFVQRTEEALPHFVARGERLAMLFLDLDDFKRVNDLLGHDAGDELLQEAARRLTRVLDEATGGRPHGADDVAHVARLGGDEFTMVLPCPGGDRAATDLAARVVGALSAPVRLEDNDFVIGTSIGIAVCPDDATSVEALMKCADTAMYEAKRGTKNTWRRFDGAMQDELARGLRLERDLRAALAALDGQLHLHFQPQLDIGGGRFTGAEALLRWRHPQLGPIGPDVFVPVAERSGLIGKLGTFVIDEACAEWHRWQSCGRVPPRVAVNVSPRQFAIGGVLDDVLQALARHRMPPSALEIELTESCMMEASAEVIATLEHLRELGVRVAMDDFGTGYSSLGALLSLPIDTLKIDRSFVTGLREGTPESKVVRAILTLAHDIGLDVVAEGVETEEELAFLDAVDCDHAQGYLLGRPVPAETIRTLFESAVPLARAG